MAYGRKGRLAALALCAAALACALMALPATATAKDYTCPQVTIEAQAETDATVRVVEQRRFDFNGSFTAVWWELGAGLPWNAEVRINGIRMARADAEGAVEGSWESLPPVTFQLAWREDGGPAHDAYSFDSARNTVYAFFDAMDESLVFELDYEVVNGVQAYDDVAVL